MLRVVGETTPTGDHETLSPDASVDNLGDLVVKDAIDLAKQWLRESRTLGDRSSVSSARRLSKLTSEPSSVAFTMAFADLVLRPESPAVAAKQLRKLASGSRVRFLSTIDVALLRVGAATSGYMPSLVMSLAKKRLRQIVGPLVFDYEDPSLKNGLERLRNQGFRVNLNLLGESVLGSEEAERRLNKTVELLNRPDVDYVSVKVSSITSGINLWDYDYSLARIKTNLRRLLEAAMAHHPPKFVNLDMEEYKDLDLTIDSFMELLSEEALLRLNAGIVLQAYLPDSFGALKKLAEFSAKRFKSGGAKIKVRIVKGANLQMERVEAELHGWKQAPYTYKSQADANYKKMLDWALRPENCESMSIGVATHNLFDIAWAKLLGERRGVSEAVEFEMLQGMAPNLASAVRNSTSSLLLYTPVVEKAYFDNAISYLFRRLEENSGGENFIHHLFNLTPFSRDFEIERARFEASVTDRWNTSSIASRRIVNRSKNGPNREGEFFNQPDWDPTDPEKRALVRRALESRKFPSAPQRVVDRESVDAILADVERDRSTWRMIHPGVKREIFAKVADTLEESRAELIAIMAIEAKKPIVEGNVEVSEAIDYARYYQHQIAEDDTFDGAHLEPLGTVVVAPPWNFPLAIPTNGIMAALAAGNSVVLKPAPQVPRTAYMLCESLWASGIPKEALRFIDCQEEIAGEHLIAHPMVSGIILTGSYQTAELFFKLAPGKEIFAETSGKNSIIVAEDADLDLAVTDIVKSAFGHAGQKCSAASLVICVGSVASSKRFERQLVDATTSLIVGDSALAKAQMGPLIEAPSGKLLRALTSPSAGESWLVEPRQLDKKLNLFSPGILKGVKPDSFFARTECFGPVLGLIEADNFEEALRIQNSSPYGLTAGLHSLDPEKIGYFKDHVEAGNVYVNRQITGAIVRRQPFGGWKMSQVGPGAKAGGKNYLTQLTRWENLTIPGLHGEVDIEISDMVRSLFLGLDPADQDSLLAAAKSDAYWWEQEFSRSHDPSGLTFEANLFRYRPLPLIAIRIENGSGALAVARTLIAAKKSKSNIFVSIAPGYDLKGIPLGSTTTQNEGDFLTWALANRPTRIRLISEKPGRLSAKLGPSCYVDDRPMMLNGRIELPRYLREQAISETLHRFGNLIKYEA